jgi:hypothetical protein
LILSKTSDTCSKLSIETDWQEIAVHHIDVLRYQHFYSSNV